MVILLTTAYNFIIAYNFAIPANSKKEELNF